MSQVPVWTLKQVLLAAFILPVNTDPSKICMYVMGFRIHRPPYVQKCIKMFMWRQYKD